MKITGIILAAGLSKRMGMVKALLPFGESTLLGRVIRNASISELDQVLVVLGHEAEKIKEKVDFGRAEIIINPDYRSGQSSSLQAGLAAISPDDGGAMFLLGDQPLIGKEIINMLLQAFKNQPTGILVPTFKGKRGNPAIIHRFVFRKIMNITGDRGARVLFDEMEKQLREQEIAEQGIVLDVDTIEDYIELGKFTSKTVKFE